MVRRTRPSRRLLLKDKGDKFTLWDILSKEQQKVIQDKYKEFVRKNPKGNH